MHQDIRNAVIQVNVIELIEKITIYKFPQKSRQELEQMFNLTDWKQTQFYTNPLTALSEQELQEMNGQLTMEN